MTLTLGQLGILLRATEGTNWYPEGNAAFLALNAGLFGGLVLDKDLTSPPAGTDQNLYIVATGGSGAWSGEDGNLAVYDGGLSAWQFIPKREGMFVWVADEDELYVYNGAAWAIFESGGTGTETGTGSPEGVVTAAVGTIYVQTDASPASDGLWYKQTGAGNTGWEQVTASDGTAGSDDGVIFDSTLGGNAASIDTGAAGIPAGYHVLEVWIIARTTESASNSIVSITLNNDSGSNYDMQLLQGANTTASAFVSTGAVGWRPSVTGANAASGNFGIIKLTIPAYAQTTANKVADVVYGNADQTTVGTRRSVTAIGGWRSTVAITRMAVTATSGDLLAGSRMLILGKPVTGGSEANTETLTIAASDESTTLTSGTNKITFHMPFDMTLTEIFAGLTTVSSSGAVTVDVNEAGSTILSTKITIDAGEKTSLTAATPPVISDPSLAKGAEITVDLDAAGADATGLKVYLTGVRA